MTPLLIRLHSLHPNGQIVTRMSLPSSKKAQRLPHRAPRCRKRLTSGSIFVGAARRR